MTSISGTGLCTKCGLVHHLISACPVGVGMSTRASRAASSINKKTTTSGDAATKTGYNNDNANKNKSSICRQRKRNASSDNNEDGLEAADSRKHLCTSTITTREKNTKKKSCQSNQFGRTDK